MQASVHSFDPASGAGVVLLDSGVLLDVDEPAFRASGLRHLRLGQRVSIELTGAGSNDPQTDPGVSVRRLWIVGIGEDQPIR